MRKILLLITVVICTFFFSQNTSFHDTQGNIEVNGGGQLQYSLPIALPPGIKSVAPQVNLIYTSGGGNGIAGYGWNLSGITSISRVGKTIEKDGEVANIKLDYSDFYSFNGQRLILKSGTYGGNGSEYVTEKFSNVKIKSIGTITGQQWQGPEYWEVTFEDGSQAWYGNITTGSNNATTPVEYNIVKWKDAQSNYISYNYTKVNNVAVITDIKWGGNEAVTGSTHFNEIQFNYISRNLRETSYVKGVQFIQDRLLQTIVVNSNGSQFKKYLVEYDSTTNVNSDPNKLISYQFVKGIKEFNSNNEEANPVTFATKPLTTSTQEKPFGDFNDVITSGDYNGDGLIDFLLRQPAQNGKPEGYYIYFDAINNVSPSSVYLGSTNTYFPSSQLLTFNIKPSDNYIKPKQGLVVIKSNNEYNPPATGSLEIKYYSIKSDASVLNTTNNPMILEYSKIINANQLEFADSLYPNTNNPPIYDYMSEAKKSASVNFKEVDIDSDGLSELLFSVSDSKCYEQIIIPDPIKTRWNCTILGYRNIVVDNDDLLGNTIHTILPPTSKNILKQSSIMDFDNDGKQDIMLIEATGGSTNVSFHTKQELTGEVVQQSVSTPLNNIYQYSIKKISGNYSIELKNTHVIKGFTDVIQFGDLNGDRNIEILAPLNKGSRGSLYNQGWSIYLNNGLGLSEFCQGFASYYKNENTSNTYQDYTYPGIVDIDNDGKSEFFNFYAGYNFQGEGFSNTFLWKLSEFKYDPNNSQFKWTYKNETILSSHRGGTSMSPIYGDFRVNGSNSKILFISKSLTNANDRKIISYHSYNLGADKSISSITQGGLTTIIDYKELDPSVNPYLYAPVKKELYPFMEMDKVSQSYAVSQVTQEGKKQDFRYRGMITHLQGKGIIGFRQTARSSWYVEGVESNKIWYGAAIDPLNEGLPTKEWSIKTNSEDQIFPTNLSLNNSQLLSYKETTYQTDVLANQVKAIVPIQSTTKDFVKDITTTNTITYNSYYLPSQTVSNVNNGFAISTTSIDYTHQPSGVGKDYFIGRPQFKTESISAYNDTKTSLEEYSYNNNLLQYLTKFDYDENEFIQEKYTYDEGNPTGFGNITQKEIINNSDSQKITTKAQYEAKGRFVIKKTDNLGLETNITYNNWGQVLTENDPLNNSITNVYDNWGKLLNSTSNLGGTTTYQYEKFSLAGKLGNKVTETSPDGSIKVNFTNYLGQNYKVITKAFEQNKYIAKEIRYDGLNRKTYESEPYITTTISPNYAGLMQNTITYDDSVFPTKVTIQSFNNGKKMETSINGRTTTIIEKNGYGRTYSKTTDAIGNLISSTDPGGTITYTYNAAGQQIKAQYAENSVTTYYDNWGRKSEFNDPANGKYQYQYTGFGDIKKEISPKGYKEYFYKPNGLLDVVIEKSNDGTSTDKNYTFTYNQYGLPTQKSGTANGKSFTTAYAYRPEGRLGWTTEYLDGKQFYKYNIEYDSYGRVKRYDQGLVSNGVTTAVAIENNYSTWDGTLYQLKQENTPKILWELQTTNAKGQVLTAKLGAAQITNAYDSFGFLDTTKHISTSSNIMDTKYIFNAIKNELTERHHYNFNIDEYFTYDNNNRLTNWTNPKTGQSSSNTYDDKGRITVNDQLGNIGYTIGGNIYRASKMNLNSNGLANYGIGGQDILLQNITYNENNDPLKIRGRDNDYSFEYGLTESRQIMHYGGKFGDNQNAKFTKYYSEDGSFEVIKNNQTGQEKHLLYIGGSPYESSIVYLKDFGSSTASFHFLHKDYLGSVLAVTNESGYAIERRHYDAWGNFTNFMIAGSNTDPNNLGNYNLLVDRGYTSHEHLAGVGLIHMNGRLYDPLLRRFLNADENIQDPTNTQSYNKYGYVWNNPLMYNDPSGEFAFIPFLVTAILKAVIFSSIIYTATAMITGDASKQGFLKTIGFSAISAGLTFGVGEIFRATGSIAKTLGESWAMIAKIGSHALIQGTLSLMQGGNFLSGALAGGFSAGSSEIMSSALSKSNAGSFFRSDTFTLMSGAVSGGMGSVLGGGNFWMGAGQGLIVTAFNYLEHKSIVNSKVNTALEKLKLDPRATPEFSNKPVIDLTVRDENLNTMYKDADYPTISLDSKQKEAGLTLRSGITLGHKAFQTYRHLYLALGHEFIHAYHYVSGIRDYWTKNFGPDISLYNTERGAYSWIQLYDAPSLQNKWEKIFQYYYGKYNK